MELVGLTLTKGRVPHREGGATTHRLFLEELGHTAQVFAQVLGGQLGFRRRQPGQKVIQRTMEHLGLGHHRMHRCQDLWL